MSACIGRQEVGDITMEAIDVQMCRHGDINPSHRPSFMSLAGAKCRVCWMTSESDDVMHKCKSGLKDVWSNLGTCAPLLMQNSAFSV